MSANQKKKNYLSVNNAQWLAKFKQREMKAFIGKKIIRKARGVFNTDNYG